MYLLFEVNVREFTGVFVFGVLRPTNSNSDHTKGLSPSQNLPYE